MRKLIPILISLMLSASLFAQGNPETADFPTAVTADTHLFVQTNRPLAAWKLSAGISGGATSLPLAATTEPPLTPGLFVVDTEKFQCNSYNSGTHTLTSCTGGQQSTTPAAHLINHFVFQYIDGQFLNRLSAEIKAIETTLAGRRWNCVTGGGAAQAQTVTLVPPLSSWTAGASFCALASASNTGADPTINPNGLGVKTVKKLSTSGIASVIAGDIQIGEPAIYYYDGTYAILVDPASGTSGSGGNAYTSISTSTTPVFARTQPNQSFKFTVSTSNSTATTSGLTAGDILHVKITQCATAGGCNFTWPTGFTEACVIAAGNAFTGIANLTITQSFFWDGSNATAVTPCVTSAAAPGAGLLRGDSPSASELSGAVATSGSNVTALDITYRRNVCNIAVGDTSGSALTNAQLGPQKRLCFIPAGATIVELDVAADAGTPNVIVGRNTTGTVVNITSAALATASAGGIACSKTTAVTGLDGATTCSATLQNTSLVAGSYLELVSGTAGGAAKWMTIHVIYTIN